MTGCSKEWVFIAKGISILGGDGSVGVEFDH